jgi:uncharacterized protein
MQPFAAAALLATALTVAGAQAATSPVPGEAAALYAQAQHYRGLTGQTLDLAKAHGYTLQAARLGYGPAQTDLAFSFFNGHEKLARDIHQARTWFERAARQGEVAALCMVGDFYKVGSGGARKDAATAYRWHALAAAQGHRCAAKAQYELYLALEAGSGVRRDLRGALAWLRRAADNHNPQAQRTLSRRFEAGDGVVQDLHAAAFWLRKSREGVAPHDHGDACSQHPHTDPLGGYAPMAQAFAQRPAFGAR